MIGRAGIGVDNVDIPAATAKGVIVMNTPFGNSITTAEHAITLMLALARQIPQADASTQAGKWEKNRFMGVEITGKTLGVIGCGNIGSIVADRAHGLRMKVIAYDPVPVGRARARPRRREGRARRTVQARRFHHAAHAADRQDQEHHRRRGDRHDEEGRAHHQLRARRAGRREGAAAGARFRPSRGRRLRRVRRGAGDDQSAVRPSQRGVHAASRRLDHGGAGERGAAGRRADVGLSAHRRHHQRGQLPLDHRRGGAQAQAVRGARREARLVRRPAHRDRHHQGADHLSRARSRR